MAQIVDQFGRPITNTHLEEPQTARLGHLQSEWENHPTRGLTPPKLAQILQQAETGDITAQHEMFADMEEKDAHLFSVMQTRRLTVSQLDWSIEPPANATSAEQDEAAFVTEVLQGLEMEDILDMTDAVGQAFHPLSSDGTRSRRRACRSRQRFALKGGFALRSPQGWIATNYACATTAPMGIALAVRLDHAHAPLAQRLHRPHRPFPRARLAVALQELCRARSGRIPGDLRTAAAPGHVQPQHPDDKARATLLRAVIGIGHDAAAIVPEGMKIEFKEAAKGESTPFDSMIGLMERSTSKAVLGGTLTSGEGEHGTQALGKVHNELRHDLKKSDARQLATTLTRQLVYPILAVNRGRTSLHRCPRLVLDTQQPEDIKLLSDSLPAGEHGHADQSGLGAQQAQDPDGRGEGSDPAADCAVVWQWRRRRRGLAGLAAMGRRQSAPAQLARLKAAPGDPTNTAADAIDSLVDAMLDEWQANSDPVQTAIQQALDSSTSFEDFRVAVEQRLAAMDATALADLLSRGTLAARLWGNLTNGGRT